MLEENFIEFFYVVGWFFEYFDVLKFEFLIKVILLLELR